MLNVIVSLQEYLSAALRRDDRGATAVEYGLLVALIAAVIVGIVATLGTQISTAFATMSPVTARDQPLLVSKSRRTARTLPDAAILAPKAAARVRGERKMPGKATSAILRNGSSPSQPNKPQNAPL